MKNESIKKINKLGKIGKIVSSIGMWICVAGVVISIIVSVASFNIPDDAAKIDFSGKGKTEVRIDEDGGNLTFETGSVRVFDTIYSKNEGDAIEEVSFDEKIGNIAFRYIVDKNENETTETSEVYDIDLMADGNLGKPIGIVFGIVGIFTAIASAFMAVVLLFLKNLFKAFEKCDSPFEENVLRKMTLFGYSLIPWGAATFMVSSSTGVECILIVVLVMIIISIFKHGAELQKESDETL